MHVRRKFKDTGANGDIGMLLVAKAPADGYTIVLGYIANLGIGPSLYKMPYDIVVSIVHTETPHIIRIISFRKATTREQAICYAQIRN